MRIAMLAGTVALAAPMVADAAAYRLSYEGSATFQNYLHDSGPVEEPFDGVVTLEASFLVDAPGMLPRSFYAGFSEYANPPRLPENIIGSAFNVEVERFRLDRFEGFTVVAGDIPLPNLSENFFFADLEFDIESNGEVTSPEFRFGQFTTPTYYARNGRFFLDDTLNNYTLSGPGQFQVENLDISPIPIPATAPMLAFGLMALGWTSRRLKSQ